MGTSKLTLDDLYSVRMVCFIESAPQSNKYYQILLNPKQFKSVSEALESQFPKEKNHKCGKPACTGTLLSVSEKILPLPENIQEKHLCKNKCHC